MLWFNNECLFLKSQKEEISCFNIKNSNVYEKSIAIGVLFSMFAYRI